MGRLPNKIKQNPKLVQREMSDGRASLWLEYYLGRTETPLYDDDGNPLLYESGAMKGKPKYKIKHNRKKEALNLYVWLHPRSTQERQQNKNTQYSKYKTVLPMDAITPDLVLGFTNYLRRKCSGEGPKKNYHWFKKVIADAVEEDIMKKNPCKGIRIIYDTNVVLKDILTPKEINRLAAFRYDGEHREVQSRGLSSSAAIPECASAMCQTSHTGISTARAW